MIFLLLAPGYLLLNYYLVRRMLKWLHSCHSIFGSRRYIAIHITVYCLLASSLLTVLLFPTGQFNRVLKVTSNYWIGTFLYLLFFVGLWDFICLMLKKIHYIPSSFFTSKKVSAVSGGVIFLLVAAFSFYGILHAHNTKVMTYNLNIEKNISGEQHLKIILLADLHLGYNMKAAEITRMINLVNEKHPDLVVIAGDIFDNDILALDNPQKICSELKRIQSTYGVYACYGNHDVQEQLLGGFRVNGKSHAQDEQEMNQFLNLAGIHLLCDETVLIDNRFYLTGRKDYSRKLRYGEIRQTPVELLKNLDPAKPIFVIDHQPKELDKLAAAGADLDLCGHTHNGQLFPGNLFVHFAWENAHGLLKKGSMYNIVTSGFGLWGPNMRVGTDSELVVINLSFQTF